MKRIRTFVAIELPPEVLRELTALQKYLDGAGAKVRWVKPENMHLTIKFLGDVDFEKTSEICRTIQNAVRDVEPFKVEVRGAGAFPGGGSPPRVIWASAIGAEEALSKIYGRLNEELAKFDIPREKRRFRPHITAGRVKSRTASERLAARVREQADRYFGEFEISELVFFMSELTSEGPIYTVLARIPLGGQKGAKPHRQMMHNDVD